MPITPVSEISGILLKPEGGFEAARDRLRELGHEISAARLEGSFSEEVLRINQPGAERGLFSRLMDEDRLRAAFEFRKRVADLLLPGGMEEAALEDEGLMYPSQTIEAPLRILQKKLKHLRLEQVEPGILCLTLKHGHVNEIGTEQLDELELFTLWANQQRSHHVLTVRSEKMSTPKDGSEPEPIFCGGADVVQRKREGWDDDKIRAHVARQEEVFDRLRRIPLFTIALAHGKAVGGGVELLDAFDYKVGTSQFSAELPEARLGIEPAAGGTAYLPHKIGFGGFMGLAIGGNVIAAEQAANIGLVDEFCPDLETAQERVNSLARYAAHFDSPTALLGTKLAALTSLERGIADGRRMMLLVYNLCVASKDREVGAGSFVEITRAAREFRKTGIISGAPVEWNRSLI